jgi:hypothetical protein
MNWTGLGRKQSWSNFKLYPVIRLEGLRKSTKQLRQDSRSPAQEFNPGPPEYDTSGIESARYKPKG